MGTIPITVTVTVFLALSVKLTENQLDYPPPYLTNGFNLSKGPEMVSSLAKI